MIKPGVVITGDGSLTLTHPLFGDTYHSVNGAISETDHVFIRAGLGAVGKTVINILDAGFGSGLNCLRTLHHIRETGISVNYTGVELYPVDPGVFTGTDLWDEPLFRVIHDCPWEIKTDITNSFNLVKCRADLTIIEFEDRFDLVYYDAFAPDTQPELWTPDIFKKIYGAMNPGGVLVTYSSKGTVKQALRDAGFEVRRLPGANGKRHMVRATVVNG